MSAKVVELALPCIRSAMGDWIYYQTALSLNDVAERVQAVAEIHKSQRLSEWIQRRLDSTHTDGITKYLASNPSRFFNSLVIGVYGGEPQWIEIGLGSQSAGSSWSPTPKQLTDLQRAFGVLLLTGEEKLFAIDGQHRVAGIKKALKRPASPENLGGECVGAILVGHQRTLQGVKRTRRLFTVLNKTSKKVSEADIIAMDEDDLCAAVTRRLFEEHELFRAEGIVKLEDETGAVLPTDTAVLTSIINLFRVTRDLLGVSGITQKMLNHQRGFTKSQFEEHYATCAEFWSALLRHVPEYRTALRAAKKSAGGRTPGYFRAPGKRNHMAFRPVGQRVLATAAQLLCKRDGMTIDNAVELLVGAELDLSRKLWDGILWDHAHQRMVSPVKRRVAETAILLRLGCQARTEKALREHARYLQELAGARM